MPVLMPCQALDALPVWSQGVWMVDDFLRTCMEGKQVLALARLTTLASRRVTYVLVVCHQVSVQL